MPNPIDRWGIVAVTLAVVAWGVPTFAAQLSVGSGATLKLGSGTLEVGCRDLAILGILDIGSGTLRGARDVGTDGTLVGGSGTLSLSRNLTVTGSLQPQTGTVALVDGCGSTASSVSGVTGFYRFLVSSSQGRSLFLPAGQTVAIGNRLELVGTGVLLPVRSSQSGVVSYLRLASSATQGIDRVQVRDVGAPDDAPWLAPQAPATYNSVDLGNSPRFFLDANTAIPTLSPPAIALLALLLGIAACFHRRRLT